MEEIKVDEKTEKIIVVQEDAKTVSKKKLSGFGLALILEVAFFFIVIVIASSIVWNKCALYQRGYDKAKEAVDPDRFATQILPLFEGEQIENLIEEDMIVGGSYYISKEEQKAYLTSLMEGQTLTLKREETSSERKPVYEVLAGENKVGVISLVMGTESDEYGFHRYLLQSAKAEVEAPELIPVTIAVEGNQTVYVNGKLLTEHDVLSVSAEKGSIIEEKATELSGKDYQMTVYEVGGLISEPVIELKEDTLGSMISLSKKNGIYHYECLFPRDQAMWDRLETGAVKGGAYYVSNANNMGSFANITPYLIAGSDAYQNIQSMQAGLVWAGTPEEFEIKDQKMLSVKMYTDSMAVVRTTYDVHRVYREVTYDETLTYDWLYELTGSGWQISDFTLVSQ